MRRRHSRAGHDPWNGEYAAGPLKAAAAYETHKNFNTPARPITPTG